LNKDVECVRVTKAELTATKPDDARTSTLDNFEFCTVPHPQFGQTMDRVSTTSDVPNMADLAWRKEIYRQKIVHRLDPVTRTRFSLNINSSSLLQSERGCKPVLGISWLWHPASDRRLEAAVTASRHLVKDSG
jgi:hypothetical protein